MNGGDEGVTAKAILHLYFAAMGGDAPAQLALVFVVLLFECCCF